jgi:putative ABC transport system permease protein
MSSFIPDLRYALRRILKNPGFTLVVVLMVALGIGANSTIFSVVNALLLRPLPYAEPEELVQMNHFYPSINDFEASVSAAGYRDYRTRLESFQTVVAQSGWGVNLTGEGRPERLTGSRVSAGFFAAYGVAPALGRGFLPEEDEPGRDRVAILSFGLWQRSFGGDASIIGRTVRLDGEAYEVVGVLPRDFRPFFNRDADIFAPLALTQQRYEAGYTNEFLTVTARLADGVTLAQARGEMDRFVAQLREERPGAVPPSWSVKLTPLEERARGEIRPALVVLFGAVALVLLIACVNVANLLLSQAATRRREIAIRQALGASGSALRNQLLTESLLLAGSGGVLGLVVASLATRGLGTLEALQVAGIENLGLDLRVVLFTVLLVAATGIGFGLAPAMQAGRLDPEPVLREGGRGSAGDRSSHRLRRGFAITQFALALALIVGAGLLVKSLTKLQSVDPGFDPENLLTFHVALPGTKYPTDTARVQFYDELLAGLAALPGVEAVGATSVLPFSGRWSTASFTIEGYELAEGEPSPWGDIRIVDPGFAAAMQIPLLRGRFFNDGDRMGTRPVVVVDEELVERYFAGRDPLAGRMTFDGENFFEIVGVVGHAAHEGLDAERRIQLYFPQKRVGAAGMFVAVRTGPDPWSLLGQVQSTVRSIDADQPISQAATMEERMADAVAPRRLSAQLLGFFAVLALLLAATGVYGVVSYLVAQRDQEMGVRMALGAERRQVVALVMRQGLLLAAVGIGLGVAGGLGLTRLLQSQLYEVEATDPLIFAAAAALMLVVAVSANLLPALRATRVNPIETLRQE